MCIRDRVGVIAVAQLSEAVALPKLTLVASQEPESVLTTTSAGQAIVGSSLSCTVTVCVQVTELSLPSSAVQVIEAVPKL